MDRFLQNADDLKFNLLMAMARLLERTCHSGNNRKDRQREDGFQVVKNTHLWLLYTFCENLSYKETEVFIFK